MVINHERQWVYLGPPKTASTTLTYLLTDGNDWLNNAPMERPKFGGTKYLGQHSMDIPPECRDYFIFASIRNPYSRVISLWWHWNIESLQQRRSPSAFEHFLANLLECQNERHSSNPIGDGFFHFTLARWFKWVERIDYFIRQESLADDLNHLNLAEHVMPPRQNVAPDLLLRNSESLPREDWSRYYSEEAVGMVRAWAHYDFERFGYPLEFMVGSP